MTHGDIRFKNVCRDWMKGSCSHSPCRFIHDPELCVEFYSTLKCKGLCNKNHFVNKDLIKSTSNSNSNKHNGKHNGKLENKSRRPVNTETFKPDFTPPEMRLLFESSLNKSQTELEFQSNDVVVVPDLFADRPNIYSELLEEIFGTKFDKQDLIIPWHEGSHLIVDDKLDWKKDCPIFNLVIDRIAKYFKMDVKATRFNWMQNLNDHKFFHYDGAALKPEIAKKQNSTIGVSFGYTRDIAFQVASHPDCRKVVSIPLPNGYTYIFNKDVNIDWRHGVLPVETKHDYKSKPSDGRISIIAWGYIEQIDMKPGNHI
jgi:hypothetical protein